MLFLIYLAQSPLNFTAALADGLATALAVVLEDHSDAPELLTTEHANARVEVYHRVKVEDLGQEVLIFRALVLKKDAVHFKRAGLHPSGRPSAATLTIVI